MSKKSNPQFKTPLKVGCKKEDYSKILGELQESLTVLTSNPGNIERVTAKLSVLLNIANELSMLQILVFC